MSSNIKQSFTANNASDEFANTTNKYISGIVGKMQDIGPDKFSISEPFKRIHFSGQVGVEPCFFLLIVNPDGMDSKYQLFMEVQTHIFHAANMFDSECFIETNFDTSNYDGYKTHYLDITDCFENDDFFKQIEMEAGNE